MSEVKREALAKHIRLVALCCLTAAIALTPARGLAASDVRVMRVLILHPYEHNRPFRLSFDTAFAETLREAEPAADLYEEAIEWARFPGGEASRALTNYLKNKYAARKIDVIIAVTDAALAFARKNQHLFGQPYIVGVGTTNGRLAWPERNVTGMSGAFVFRDTIELALALRPGTRVVYVVDGTRADSGNVRADVQRQLHGFPDVTFIHLRDLPLNELVARVANIPEQSVLLFVRQTMRDESNDLDDPYDGLSQVVRASRAPVFSANELHLGRGVVGGHVWRFEADARRAAQMATRLATGSPIGELPIARSTTESVVDWRQLRRWQIPTSRVPDASAVMFQPPSFFREYRRYVVGGLLVFAAQLALIVGLLLQGARRRFAEEESRRNEERYRSVVETQSELICRFLPDTTLTFVNDAYCRYWNQKRGELIGRRFIDLVPAAARKAVRERVSGLLSGTDSHEHAVALPDGTIGWQHWTNHVILDERGRLREIQGVGCDITDRKRAEEAVSLLETRNSAILRAIPDLMFVLLRDGTYVDYHARDPEALFAPADDFIGKTVRDVMPPELAAILMDAIERAIGGEDPVVVEYDLQLPELRSFEARLVDAGDDRVLSIVRDVTDTKRTLRRNRALVGRLITAQEAERSRIARDLHDGVLQDLAAASVDVSHLRQQRAIAGDREMQDLLLGVQRRTNGVAETLRLLSHGLHPSVLQHVGLVPALSAHCAEFERQYRVKVTVYADDNGEPASQLVALSLFRIAQEALRNTAKYAQARRATVSLRRDEHSLTLRVVDDGIGFDAAAQHNGGLGLVSIEERARLIDGRIVIRSQPGQGTSIEVVVPAEIVDQPNGRRAYQKARPLRRSQEEAYS